MTIRPLDRVAPTTFARLIACPLRVAFEREGDRGQSPSSPSARLGTAAHRVLAAVASQEIVGDDVESFSLAIEHRWTEEVRSQGDEARRHDLERVFGEPNGWSSLHDLGARLVAEAIRLRSEVADWGHRKRLVEERLQPTGSPFYGTPDLVLDSTAQEPGVVVDFKTGRKRASDRRSRDQVLIYAHLADDAGFEIEEGEIRYIGLPSDRFPLAWDEVSALVDTAKEEIASFNKSIIDGEADRLGRPSPVSCDWCPHATRCPAYWKARATGTVPDLGGAHGRVVAVEQARGLMNLTIDDDVIGERVLVARLPTRRLPQLTGLREGELLSVVGLRPDDSNPRTLCSSPTSTWVRVARGGEIAYPG